MRILCQHSTPDKSTWRWRAGSDSRRPQTLADQAVGQLLQLESRLGHADGVEAVIADIGTRALTGAATEQYSNAKQAVWVMGTAPEEAFRCGPHALAQMIRAVRGDTPPGRRHLALSCSQGCALLHTRPPVNDRMVKWSLLLNALR